MNTDAAAAEFFSVDDDVVGNGRDFEKFVLIGDFGDVHFRRGEWVMNAVKATIFSFI